MPLTADESTGHFRRTRRKAARPEDGIASDA